MTYRKRVVQADITYGRVQVQRVVCRAGGHTVAESDPSLKTFPLHQHHYRPLFFLILIRYLGGAGHYQILFLVTLLSA